eukprot:1157375-Pelagomonas_calceolata.AAC.2
MFHRWPAAPADGLDLTLCSMQAYIRRCPFALMLLAGVLRCWPAIPVGASACSEAAACIPLRGQPSYGSI